MFGCLASAPGFCFAAEMRTAVAEPGVCAPGVVDKSSRKGKRIQERKRQTEMLLKDTKAGIPVA